jgi:hypothetical protein
MENKSITFETKVWEGDWKMVLKTGRLKRIIESCRYNFDERVLYINNVNDRQTVLRAAEKYLKSGILTSIIFVEDAAKQTLEHFNLTFESFKGGYYYSIQELTGILNCKTKYLLHLTGDTIIKGRAAWINSAIERMEHDSTILTVNPNGDPQEVTAKGNLLSEDELYYKGFGFSDQCYLIRAADFRENIYNETHEASKRYPCYGGELFEKRIDSYMRNHGLYRLTCKTVKYEHKNFPKDQLRRFLLYTTGINLKKGR